MRYTADMLEYQKALDQAQKELEEYNMQQRINMEDAFKEAELLDVLRDDSEDESQQLPKEDSTAVVQKDEIKSEDVPLKSDTVEEAKETETKEPQTRQSEEFWDYNKKMEEQLKCYEDGEALNNLFEDKDELLRIKQEELEKEKARL